jgi:hypothetical protein
MNHIQILMTICDAIVGPRPDPSPLLRIQERPPLEGHPYSPDLSLLADTFQLLADFVGECDRQKGFDSEKVMITIETLHQCIAQKTLKALGKA